jgi:predicted AAA+ superfamily ATPase
MLIKRQIKLPSKSFFLLGPRGTGKSTVIREQVKIDLTLDLLKSTVYLPLVRNPSLLAELTGHLKEGDWVFIDEVQKIPALLDEVHALYEEKHLNFALSGSSARKLRRGGANLLAGRALQAYMFPFVFIEYNGLASIEEAIEWGTLPLVVTDSKNRKETLSAYVETYLKQELIEEGLIRKLDPFVRFLEAAGIYNAQVLNIENVAREAGVSRTTVDKYFQILEETLIGFRLPALKEGIKTKEIQHPKFYLFDPGVARACAGQLGEEVDSVWKGFALETLILNELRAYNFYSNKNKSLFFYQISSSYDIDFIIETKKKTLSTLRQAVLISVKYSKKWDKRWNDSLVNFKENAKTKVNRMYGVYRGDQILTQGDVTIYPVQIFLEKLFEGSIY